MNNKKNLSISSQLLHLFWINGFVIESVKREFQARYKNSLLGAFWNVINPLAMIFIYTVVFANVMRAKLPGIEGDFAYSIFLCAGILTWGLFAEIINKAQMMFIDNANLLKKINFPHSSLLVIVILNALLNFFIITSLFLVFLIFTQNFPGWVLLAALPILVLQILLAIGLGLLLGVLNVFFRDIGQFSTIFITFWFWFTPIVYPFSILPESIQRLIALNPMTGVALSYQTIFVQHEWPNWSALWPAVIAALVFCLLGFRLFKKHAGELVDEL